MGVPYFGVLVLRIRLFRVLCKGPLFSENPPISFKGEFGNSGLQHPKCMQGSCGVTLARSVHSRRKPEGGRDRVPTSVFDGGGMRA